MRDRRCRPDSAPLHWISETLVTWWRDSDGLRELEPAGRRMNSVMEKSLSSFCLSEGDEPELYSMLPQSGSRHRCFTLPSSPFDDGAEEIKMDDACNRTVTTKVRKKRKRPANSLLQIDQETVAASLKSGLYRPCKEETLAFSQLQDLYNRAVKFRDYYFEHFPTDRASRRVRDIAEIVAVTLEKMGQLGGIFKPRNLSWYFAYRALCLSIDTVRAKEAHEELQFAVRHLAHFPRLWIALGESFWEQSNFYAAISCFEKASMLDRASVLPIINISCSHRLLLAGEKDTTEKCRMLLKMVAMARYAVSQGAELGDAWYNLGNALLVYFNVKTNRDLIIEALESFEKAAKCRILQGKAEFHYNYGIAHLLCGNYQEALGMWKLADALEPEWSSPKKKTEELVKYLSFVSDLVSGKDRTFRRRAKQLGESVPVKNLSAILNEGASALKLISVKELKDNKNDGFVAHGKIYATTYQTPDPSRLIFLIDATGDSVPVVIYNMGTEFSVGGSVSIPDPVVRSVQFSYEKKRIFFRYIRVDEPWKMYHNLIKVPMSLCAQTLVSTSAVPRRSGGTE